MSSFSSISGTSNSSSSGSMKGIGGLVSGLDTDELVEQLTSGTSSKIDTQKKKLQTAQWQKEAYRTLTTGLMEFNNKYFSSTSSTNITNSSFFELYKVNDLSSKIGLSGKLQNAKNVTVDKIEQLATKASYSYKTGATSVLDAPLKLDTDDKYSSDLDGQALTVTAGGKSYVLKFDADFGSQLAKIAKLKDPPENDNGLEDNGNIEDFSTKMESMLNRMLRDAGAVGKNGEQIVKASVTSDGLIRFQGTGTIQLNGTEAVMRQLGFGNETKVSGSGSVSGINGMNDVLKKADFATQMSNKEIRFYLDGVMSTVTLGEYRTVDYKDASGNIDKDKILQDVTERINKQLKKDFGTRADATGVQQPAVEATYNSTDGTMKFNVQNGETSTFAIDQGGKYMLGEDGVFGVDANTATKFNASMTIKDMNLKNPDDNSKDLPNNGYDTLVLKAGKGAKITILNGDKTEEITLSGTLDDAKSKLEKKGFTVEMGGTFGDQLKIIAEDTDKAYISKVEANPLPADAPAGTQPDTLDDILDAKSSSAVYEMNINGSKIVIKESDSLSKIMDKVSQSDANVNMTYTGVTGSMKLESKTWGAGRDIEFGTVVTDDDGNEKGRTYSALERVLFGADKFNNGAGTANPNITHIAGKNAKATLTVNGEEVTVERASNTITLDGLNIELKGTTKEGDEPITFDVQLDSDQVVENVKEFIETYNALLVSINTAVTTKQDPDNKYEPLTDAQKEDMSESQIEKWETEAKKSVLFGDSTLKGVMQSMRSALYGAVNGVSISLTSVGITTGEWSKNGQLEFDEATFRKMLSENPDKVAALFTQQSSVPYNVENSSAKQSQRYKESGLMYRFQDILKGAVGTSTPKGSLLQIAGISGDRTDTENQLTEKMKRINEQITKLEKQLKTERQRYWDKFTNLETTIQKLNSQSSYLSSMFE